MQSSSDKNKHLVQANGQYSRAKANIKKDQYKQWVHMGILSLLCANQWDITRQWTYVSTRHSLVNIS